MSADEEEESKEKLNKISQPQLQNIENVESVSLLQNSNPNDADTSEEKAATLFQSPESPNYTEINDKNLKVVTQRKSSHYRSLSDGCTLQVQPLQATNIPGFNVDSVDGANASTFKRTRKTSVPHSYNFTPFEFSDPYNDMPMSLSGGSRFPRPKPGETLVSFLSSADLYKNCGSLDRENAHFYISEAILAAFEQMRFEGHCKEIGLLSSSSTESDEEIAQLQEKIKQKRQQNLARKIKDNRDQQAPAVSCPAVTDLVSSTTDYSVYESPVSSAYTESSDPLSDANDSSLQPEGTLFTRRISSRPKRKVFRKQSVRQRTTAQTTTFKTDEDLSYNESEDEITAAGSGSSCCTLSNIGMEKNDSSSTVTERRGSSDTLHVLSNEELRDKERNGDQCKSSSLSFPESSTLKESTLKESKLYDSNCSSAEGIGLRLLQDVAAPVHQLPKASELQWLVSERDVPQKLLPMPSESETLLLRGTNDWAPPREQLILTLKKETKRAALLSAQQYRCAGCGQQVSHALSKHYRLCHYFTKYFCATCHMNQLHTIPAKVLHQWDTRQYPVSCFAHQLLTKLYSEPLFYPAAINATLYHNSKSLNQFRLFRLQLFFCLPYITTCSRAQSDREVIKRECPSHWSADKEVVSLEELCLIKSGSSGVSSGSKQVLDKLQFLTQMCIKHVAKCPLCQGRGFICEVCSSEPVIFPFELATVRVCDACGSCTHYRCPLKQCRRCCMRNKRK